MKKFLTFITGSALAIGLPLVAAAVVLSTPVNVGTSFPAPGGTASVSGSCGAAGANNSVSFSLVQNGATTALPPSANISTDASGAFSGNITLPASAVAGPATLVATCNASGDTANSPVLTFSAPASTSLTVGTTGPIIGGVANLSGACGNSGGTGTVQLNLINNGTTTALGSANLSSTGTFNTNVVIPGTITVPGAVLSAICSNGVSFSSPVTLGPLAINLFSFSDNPVVGSTTTARGACLGGSADANGTVGFSLLRMSGTNIGLPASSASTNTIGAFAASLGFPSTLSDGLGTLVVTCPSNSSFTVLIAADPGSLSLAPPAPAVGGTPAGSVPGATTTTPVGGVDAGHGPSNANNALAAVALMLIGSAGLLTARRLLYS